MSIRKTLDIRVKLGYTDKWSELSPSIKKEYFTFSFVRNPLSRSVSAFCYLQQFYPKEIPGIKDWNFEDWIDYVCKTPDAKINQHARSQYIAVPPKINFIGKFERIRQDWQILRDMLGLPQLKYKQKSKHGPYLEYYNSETKKRIESRYEKDFLTFGY
jgi:hypothetical protein